jgi:hypothetical protein
MPASSAPTAILNPVLPGFWIFIVSSSGLFVSVPGR